MKSTNDFLKCCYNIKGLRDIFPGAGFITEERGLVPMKGKGEVLTYWLLGAKEENPVQTKLPDQSILKQFFRPPNTLVNQGANSQEVRFLTASSAHFMVLYGLFMVSYGLFMVLYGLFMVLHGLFMVFDGKMSI